MSTEDKKWLYGRLGLDLNYDEFEETLSNDDDMQWYYDRARNMGLEVGTYDEFNELFGKPVQVQPTDSTYRISQGRFNALVNEETPEEKAERKAIRQIKTADKIAKIGQFMSPVSSPSTFSPTPIVKVSEPKLPTPEQIVAAEDERLFKQHLKDSGQIQDLYNLRDYARENDGSNGIWDYINPLGEKAPIGGAIHLLRSAFSEDYRDKKRAQKQNRLIAEQVDKAIDVYEQATGDRNGISSVFNAVADEASRISTWDLGMTDLQNAATLYDLSQKDESELTAAEKATLNAIGLASSVMSLYGDEVGMGYKIGQGVPATLSFMGSMALNPLAGYGKKLAGNAVKKFGKDYVKRVAKRAAGDILETGAYVGSVALPQVAANALDRINGSTTYDLDDDLNVVYGEQENQETLGNAIWKALGETFIEGYTERMGDYFDPIIGFAKGVTKGIKAGKLSDFAEALVDVKPTATMQNIRRFKEKTLFNGTLSELMEEELGMAMNAFTVGDYTFDKEKAENEGKTYIFDPENQFVTAMSVGMFSAAINGTEMAANHAYKRKVNKVAEKYGKIAERELGAQFSEMIDGVPSLKERVDNADADEKSRIINDIFANPNLSDKQKKAAATYAVYRQYAQTFNAVQANALNHKADEVKEQHAAYEAGYSSALPAFYNIANAFKDAQQDVNDYTERTGDSSVMDAIQLIENNPSEIKNIRDGLTDEQYQLVTNYKNTLERYRGAYQGRNDKLEDYMDEVAFVLEPAINADANGNRTITTAIYKDEPVYVTYNDGTNATIMRFNGEKLGDKTPLLTQDLSEIVSHDAEQYINDYRRQITGQMDAETENAFEHHPKTQAPQVGLQLQSPEGEVVITAVNDNMVEIVPAVYKDGQVQPKEGAEPRTITVDDAYAWQDDYYQGIDNAAATASQPTVDNMSANEAQNEGTPTEQIEQSVSEEVADGQIAETQPTETESVAPVAPAAPQTARERVPKDDKGNPIYEQTDADTAWDAIVEETEGDTEMAQRVAADMLEDKRDALAKLQKGKPKKGATVAEKIANEKAHAAAIAQAQNDVTQWEAIVGTEARRREAAMSEADRYAAEMEQKSINEGLKALGEPQSLEEYVLGQLAGGSYKLRWSDKENGTKGFGSHTGLSTEEMKARLSMIDNKNGLTPEEIAHSIVENMDMSFGEVDVMDVTNMVIDAVATHASRRAMLKGMVESRAELLRQQARAEQEAKDAWYMEQYHATEEELAAYNEYLAEFAEEIYGEDVDYEQRIATFAEIQLGEYDNQGTDAGLRSSADQGEGLASDREGGRSVGETEQLDRREFREDADGVAEAEDGRAGSSVSAESDDRQSRINRVGEYYRNNVDDSPEALAAAERDWLRYQEDLAADAAETVETLENGDVRRTNRNSRGEIATVAIERDGNVISVDTYEDGALFEHTDYDANGNAISVDTYEDGEVVSEQEYKDGKRNVTANVEDIRRTPLSELEYVKRETDRLFNERESQSLSRKEWELTDEGLDAENVAFDSYPSYIQSLSDSGELQRMFDSASVGEETQIRRAVEAAGLELDDVIDTSAKRANAKAARDKKRAEKAKKLIESVTTNKEKQNGAEETIPEGGPRGRRSEKQGENQGDTRQSKSVIDRQIEEFELRTGWSRGLSDTERLILEDVRKLTDSEISALRNEAIESIERGEDVEDIEIVLSLLEKYGRSGERLYILSQSGIIPNQPVLLDKVEQLFMEYNEDEGLSILFDRLRPIIEQVNPKITFEVIRDVDGNVKDSTVGDFYLKDNHLRFNLHSLNSSFQTDQEKANTIVHEMLHAVTQYALDAKQRVNDGEEVGVELSNQLLDAAQSLINIYNAVKGNPILAEEYGIKDVHEMVSELANPEFRDKLKQIEVKGKSAWERIKDAIKRFLNRFGDIYDTSAYNKAMSALGELMDNFDIKAYERSRALGSEAKESRVDNLRFREKEESKELIAVHNISENNLKKVLESGSLIMPSIAITKVDMGHDSFGEISLLFDKSTINPFDRRNKVYGGDAWTPRFPRIGVKLNEKVVSRINKKAYELIEDRRLREIFSLSSEVYPDNIEKVISDYGVEGYYNKEWIKLAYLLDSGKKVKVPTKAKDYGIASEDIVRLAKEKGLSVKEIYEDYDFYKNNPDFVAQVKEARDEARLSSIPEEQRDEMRERMQSRPLSEAAFDSYIRGALEMEGDLANGGLKEIVDRQALRDLVEKKVKTDNAEYNKWVDNLFEGIVEKRGIRNNRDWYTPSGNLRPWGQLYDPATPANILKYMLAENEQGGSGGFFDSNIMGASAETYESIEEIREKGKKRLKQLPYEEYDEWSNSIADRMAKICDDFLSPSQKNSMGGAIDAKIEITNAVAKDKTAKGIYKHMKREYPNFTMELAKQVEEIVKEIQEFATGYFEAKPQRLVSVNEVMAAVVPSNASKEIVDALKNNGIEVVTYKKGDEEARKRVVKRVSSSMDIKFREGEGPISDREVSYENDPIAKFQGKPRYYGKRAAAFAERERRRMENAAKEAAEVLGIEVEIVTDASTLQGRKAKAKGWYDIINKKVVVVVPNHVSMGDAVRTVLHEGVAHHGLRELFGDGFDAMLDNVYNNVAPELKSRIDAIAERTGVSTSVATEEYLASLAETTNFEEAQRLGWWAKIKQYFVKMLDKLGMPGLNLKEELTDNELRYLLWRSYQNLVDPNSYLKPLGYINDVAKQKELKVGNYAEKKQVAPIAAEMSEAEEWAEVTMQRIEELEARMAQLENEIAEMEADRDADDESRYDMWEEQLDVLRKQSQEIYDELEGLYSLEAEAEEMSMASEDAIRYRIVEDQAEIDRLESEPTIKAYRAMQVINGELYPPMSAVVDGKLREPIALGQWEQSEERPDLADDNGRFKLDKGNKKSLKAAYNPYFHSSSTPLNDQFSEAQDRDNLVTVEVEVPVSEADGTSGYKAEKAKDAVGTHQWKAGIIQGQLTGTREVFLTRWDKPMRIVPESEVADVIVEMFAGKDIVMPSNVVTPQLRKELEARGIAFVETDNQGKLVEGEHKGEHYSKVYGKKSTKKSKNKAKIIAEVEREAAALGVPVRIARSVDELPDEDTRKRAVDGKLKGYFDPHTGEVVVYEPNTDDANDAKRTVLHEIVGHKGLRSLIGEQQYDKAMLQLMYMLPSEMRDAVLRRAERHGWNAAIAMDEYLAEQAERDVQPTWWGKVNAKIRALLRNMGFNVMLTDADVTYLLWRSRKKLQGDSLNDMAVNAILKQAARKSAEAEAWNEQAFKDAEMRDFERNALPSIRHRMGADVNDYEKAVRTLGFKQAESWQDSMRSLLVFQQALAKTSGKDISDFENAYMYENRMSSANLMEMEQYRHMVYNPLLKEIHELEQMGASRESIINYLFAKSGLERNEVFARRDAKKHAEGDAAKEQQLYDKYRQKDYAGLTALTRGDEQIAALVDDHSDKKTKYDRLEQNKKRGVAVSDADLKAAKKEMDDARKAMITAIEAEAQRMVDEFEAQHNTDNLWDKIRNCTHTTLNISHDAGVMSDEVYNELWNQFQYYIPLRGFAETTAEDVYLYLGGSDSPYNAPIKTAYGRTSLADDPIATIGNMAESAIVEANRNRLKQRFLYMVERHNTDLASVSDVWLEYDDVNDEWHTVFAQIPDDATPSDAKRLQQEFEDKMKQLAEQNPDKYANASQQPNIPYRVVKKGDRQEHHVIVKRNGKDVVITINGNPRVAQAINGLTNPDQNQGMITRITSWINRNLSANFTMRNPAFMVSNFVRDGFYTNSMVWVKENPAYARQYNKNWAICTAQIASLVKRYKRHEKGDTTALDMNNDMDRMFYEFMINGGETGYTVIKSVEDYKGLISGEMKKMEAGAMGTARRVADTIGNVVDTFGRWAEDTSRFAAYMTSRQLGRTITKSIWDAKEISVNFNKKGSGNRMMGKFEQGNRLNYVLSNMSQLGRNLYVFWNAGVQGFNNFKKAAKDSPAKFTAMAGTYFTLGVIVAAAFSGDDDEDDYYNLPEYVRRNNICFKIGRGKYATLPLPIEIRAIYGLGELAYSYLSGREGLTHGEAVTKTIQQITQVMPIDMMADGGGAMALVPSAAKPVVEVIHNVDWTGRPIYKEKTPWNQNDPTWTLAFKSTSPELVQMSRLVNEWTNKNTADGLERPYNRGWADNRYLNNPAVWEHIAEGYLGGMATMFNQTKKTLMMPFNEDLREMRNVPIVSRFVKDAGKEGRSYAARNEYYDAKNIMDSWKNEMSKAKKEVLDESLTDEQRLKAAKLRSSLEQQYMEAAERWKVLDRQRKALEEAFKSDQSEENRQALDDVMMQMATLVGAYK